MAKITTDFNGTETTAITKARLTEIVEYFWGTGALTNATTWGEVRLLLNKVGFPSHQINDNELAAAFRAKLNHLNETDNAPLVLDFTSGTLPAGVTFTRAGTATYFDANGVLQTAAADQPRFDYDPVTKAPKGLLIEGSRTNLLTYSSEFSNAVWSKSNSTIVENSATAPDGTLTADKLVENTSNTPHYLYQVVTTAAGSVTVSYRVKANGRNYLQIRLQEGGAFLSRAEFNLSTGTAIPISGSVAKIVALKDGWHLISLTATSAGSSTFQTQLWLYNDTPVSAYTGDGTSGIYVWGAQLEVGAFPSSYIPTTTAAATRAADSAVMTGADFARWFNPAEGTFLVEFERKPTGVLGIVLSANRSAAGYGPRQYIFANSANIAGYSLIEDELTQSVILYGGTIPANNICRIATGYKTNDFATSLGGATVVTDGSGVPPSGLDFLSIGSDDAGGAAIYGHFHRLRYWPRRLSNSFLQRVTA